MKRTITSAIALGVFLLTAGASAMPAALAQDDAGSVSLDPSSPGHPESGEAAYWCWDPYYGWYPCSWGAEGSADL